MTQQRMQPADHIYIEALTAITMMVVHDPVDEKMLVDIAAGIEPRVNLSIDALCRVMRAFSAWRLALKVGSPGANGTDRAILREAVREFHRWRLGAAQEAMQLQAS